MKKYTRFFHNSDVYSDCGLCCDCFKDAGLDKGEWEKCELQYNPELNERPSYCDGCNIRTN
jgi:hypothetical protein